MQIIKALALYLPFEVFILKWLPVGDTTYLVLRELPDLIILSMAGLLLVKWLLAERSIPIAGGGIDVYLALFVFWAFVTILMNPGADIFTGILNIKAILRYVLLLYILLMLDPTPEQIDGFLNWLGIVIFVQAIIGILQFFGGDSVTELLAARHVSEAIGGVRKIFTGGREGNDLMGTMGDTISFGYFMMLGLILQLSVRPSLSLLRAGAVFVFLVLTFLSGSKAIFLTSLMIIYGFLVSRMGLKKVLMGTLLLLPILLFIGYMAYMAIPDSMIEAASAAFSYMMAGMMNSRLGIVVYILPKIILTPHNIIGFSPDKKFISEYVFAAFPSVPVILLSVLPKVLDDVYWVAMYFYYGLVGFTLWILFLLSVYRRIKRIKVMQESINPLFSYIETVSITLMLASIPLNFLDQTFEVRSFSFYLWLFCGLAFVHRRQALAAMGNSG